MKESLIHAVAFDEGSLIYLSCFKDDFDKLSKLLKERTIAIGDSVIFVSSDAFEHIEHENIKFSNSSVEEGVRKLKEKNYFSRSGSIESNPLVVMIERLDEDKYKLV